MAATKISSVVMVGAGNLASHLALALARSGIRILQIVNRSPQRGIKLAKKCGASYTSELISIDCNADLYIVAVSDQVLPLIAGKMKLEGKLVVHTSGTVEMNVLQCISQNTGVLYPLQTFNESRRVNFRKIPLCIEARNEIGLQMLTEMAARLSSKVYRLDGNQRKVIHLAAVIACNFTNYMYTIAEDLITRNNLPFEFIRPLIEQTARNAKHDNLFRLQTGPAVRGDLEVMEEHLRLLTNDEEYREIYSLLSKNIIKHKTRNG